MTAVVELEFIVLHVFVSSLSTYVNKVVVYLISSIAPR